MTGFLLSFLAALITGTGARDQMTVARLTEIQGARPALLVVALTAAAVCTGASVWLAAGIITGFAPSDPILFTALLMIAAGVEVVVLRPTLQPVEPTNSLFAAFVVLLSLQLADAARLVVLAVGVGMVAPLTSGAGGFAGSALAITLGWTMPARLRSGPLVRWRLASGLLLIAGGLFMGYPALIA
ncbi:MAG: hypothetical protein V4579_06265 [Pseudomonadota bacterium]